jgi:hypothetical protein
MGRRAKVIPIIPRWVDEDDDLTIHPCTEDVCRERAVAIRVGADRQPSAKPRFRLGQDLFGQARDRGLSALRRTKLLLRAEQAFIVAEEVARHARRADVPEGRCRTCGQGGG